MTIEQLRAFHQARPFQPFTLHLADGRSVYVMHDEFLAQSQTGRTVSVSQPDGAFEIIDLLFVASIAVAAPTAAPGNGQPKE